MSLHDHIFKIIILSQNCSSIEVIGKTPSEFKEERIPALPGRMKNAYSKSFTGTQHTSLQDWDFLNPEMLQC